MPSATNGGSMKRSSVKPSGRGSRSWSCIARRSPIGPDGPSKKHFHAARSAFRAVYLARLLSSSRRPSAVRSDWRPNASSAAGGASRDGLGLLTPTLLLRRERGHQAGADRGFRRGRKRGVSRDPRRAAPKAFCASSKGAVGVGTNAASTGSSLGDERAVCFRQTERRELCLFVLGEATGCIGSHAGCECEPDCALGG